MEKLAKNNQYNHYCEKCKAWKLHARGHKFYRCLACNTKTPRGLTTRAADVCPACAGSGEWKTEGGCRVRCEPCKGTGQRR